MNPRNGSTLCSKPWRSTSAATFGNSAPRKAREALLGGARRRNGSNKQLGARGSWLTHCGGALGNSRSAIGSACTVRASDLGCRRKTRAARFSRNNKGEVFPEPTACGHSRSATLNHVLYI